MYRLYQILCFVLKKYLNFKLYKKMLIIYCFILFFINKIFVLDVMYITPHLHVVKDSWNFKFLFNRFKISKNLKFHNFQIVSAF